MYRNLMLATLQNKRIINIQIHKQQILPSLLSNLQMCVITHQI